MTKEKEKKVSKDQLLLEAARLGNYTQLETVLSQMQQLKSKKKSNPLASLRKSVGPNSIRDPITGFTCLHHASLNGHAECVKLILDYGAKLNALDYKGSSALHLAAWAGNLEVVKIFLKRLDVSSSVNSSNLLQNSQDSPNTHHHHLHLHQQQQQQHTTTTTANNKQQVVNINLCNNDNQTPLSLAAQFGHLQVVAELLSAGANPNIRNNQLESPLDLASLNGRQETVELLIDSCPSLLHELKRPRSIIYEQTSLPSDATSLTTTFSHQVITSGAQQTGVITERPVSITGETLSPTSRRQSAGGWSSLLRGRRDSSNGSQSHQSPLHRLTAGTLSMRQKSPTKPLPVPTDFNQEEPATSSPPANEPSSRRRATLTAGAPLVAASQPRQVDTTEQQQQSTVVERLLDHSPLHYATRRGHANVLNLLLVKYKVNILQVTTLGGLLHEIALNNGKHSDMIGLLFNHISSSDPTNRLELLDQFVNLKNAQNKNVFEVLNEINNRSAQEMKRLIYEFSEQIQRNNVLPNKEILANVQKSLPVCGNRVDLGSSNHQQQMHQQISNKTLTSLNGNLPAFFDSSQSEQQQQQQKYQSNHFSDIQQINSFLTMKRAPARQQQVLRELNQNHPANQRFSNFAPNAGTQTIDRRSGTKNPVASIFDPNKSAHRVLSSLGDTNNIDENHQLMTRSVSNLNQVPYNGGILEQHPQFHNSQHWSLSQQVSVSLQQQQQQQPMNEMDLCMRKRRSKSRDLGSLLMEAKQVGGEPLYDNSMNFYPSESVAAAQSSSSWAGGSNHQLVRSQTDCSHLMGRFFGSSESENQHLHHQMSAPKYSSLQQHAPALQSADRRTINRHYHVYDHEFYPPRLLAHQAADQASGMKHTAAIAVVPPLISRAGEQQHQHQLRASISSTRSSQSSSSAPGNSQVHNQQHKPMDRFLVRHSRKLANSCAQNGTSLGSCDESSIRSSSVDQKRQDLIQLQRRLLAESTTNRRQQQQQQQQQQSLTNSLSLESHLSEPHLFESTRKALMHDFDRMIGSELLNRSHRQIIDGSLQHRNSQALSRSNTGPHSEGSTQSILTGVLLDMDRYGERLTIRGTRVLFPNASTNTSTKPTTNKSAQTSPHSSYATKMTQVQEDDDYPVDPPPKPPRLSLLNKKARKPNKLEAPASCLNSIVDGAQASNRQQQQQIVAAVLKGNRLQAPLTEPPQIKPPPLPSEGPTNSQPLHVVAPSPHLTSCCSSSTGSSSECHSEIGLLKLASLTSGSSVGSSTSNGHTATHTAPSTNQNQAPMLHATSRSIGVDLDSGICTSNSPASMSHDSESGGPSTDFRGRSAMLDNNSTSSAAVVRHLVRPSSVHPRSGVKLISSTKLQEVSAPSSPPSPNTAQLCIEEVLTRSVDVAALTAANQTDQSYSLCSVDRWLGNENMTEADYENCQPLQLQIQQQLQRCPDAKLNLENLLGVDETIAASVESNEKQSTVSVSPKSHTNTSRTEDDIDDDDYAESIVSSLRNSCEAESSSGGENFSSTFSNSRRKEVLLKVVIDENEQSKGSKNNDDLDDTDDTDNVFYIDPLELRKIALKRSQADAQTLTDEELCAAFDKESGYIRFTLRKRRNNRDFDVASQTDSTTGGQSVELNCNKKSKLDSDEKTNLLDSVDQDQNNNSNVNSSESEKPIVIDREYNKQTGTELSCWFSTNLVALVDYSVKFLQNGLDNIRFLNHPRLLNDQILESIGINDASHRMLILERTESELPAVDFSKILFGREEENLCPTKILKLLDMTHLSNEILEKNLASNWIQNLREKSLILPIGYRTRLTEALDRYEEKEVSSLKTLEKQISSDSSEVDMDHAQTLTNSSSSKESIKSIVMKEPQLPAPTDQLKHSNDNPSSCNETQQASEVVTSGEQVSAKSKVTNNLNNSLVSEAARKLELTASHSNPLLNAKAQLKPVAAARRINNKQQQLTTPNHKQSNSRSSSPSRTTSPKRAPVFVPVKSICWPPVTDQAAARKRIESSNCIIPNKLQLGEQFEKRLSEGKVTAINSVDSSTPPPTLPPKKPVLSAEEQTSNRARPKPAPPAKPAKLVAVNKMNHRF